MPPRTPPGIIETRSRQFLLPQMRSLRTPDGRRLAPQSEKRARDSACDLPPWNGFVVLKNSSSYDGGCLRVCALWTRHGVNTPAETNFNSQPARHRMSNMCANRSSLNPFNNKVQA